MQSLKQIVQTNQLNTAQGFQNKQTQHATAMTNSTSSGKCIENANTIFLKFSIFYGHVWRSQFKNEHYSTLARKEWSKTLQVFNEELIEKAIQECLEHREFPPTLTQFVECCKQLGNRNKGFYVPEVAKNTNPLVAQAYLKKIKSILHN